MSTGELPARPRQLVMSAGIVIGGSLLLIASVFDSLANLQSVQTREQLQEVLGSPAGRDLGVTLDQATAAVRVAVSVAGVCAAIAFVLGIFVLQRHRGARILLSVVAVPLLVTAPLVGGFLGALVAVAALLLWSGPAGDWYAGRPVRTPDRPDGRNGERGDAPSRTATPDPPPVAAPTAAPTQDPRPSEHPPSTLTPSDRPGATQGFGRPVPEGGAGVGVGAVAGPEAGAPEASYAPPAGAPRGTQRSGPPTPVRLACVVTGVFSGVVSLLCLAAIASLVIDPQAIVDQLAASREWAEAGLGRKSLLPLLWVGVLILLGWSLGAVVLAWLVWRRHDWARYLLVVSAGLTFLVGIVSFPVGLVHQVACVVTAIALFSPRARAWFDERR